MSTSGSLPAPECPADEQILLLLGERAAFFWIGKRFDWRAAQLTSWEIPVACCVRCREPVTASGGLTCRHTTHSACFPEAWDGPNVWPPRPCRCDGAVAYLEAL